MGAYTESPGSFEIGRVIGRTLSLMGSNALLFAGLALLLLVLPLVLFVLIVALLGVLFGVTGKLVLPLVLGGLLAWFLANGLLQAAFAEAALASRANRRPSFGACMLTALSLIFPLIAVTLLSYGAMLGGFLLGIFPSVIAACALIAAIPVLVHERCGIWAALGRSVELTRGARWKIFALLLISATVYWVGLGIVLLLRNVIGEVPVALLRLLLFLLSAIVNGTVAASIYLELRTEREGEYFGDLAAVFA